MDGVDGLYEITGHVSPSDAYRHLSSQTFTFEEFRITFVGDGRFTCSPEKADFSEATERKIKAYVESLALASDEVVTVSTDNRRYQSPERTAVRATASINIEALHTARAVVEHVDGTVSPNPSETAWLAAVLLNDDKVAAVAAVLKEARTAARKRTRDDWIAFEMMLEDCGGRHELARATGLKEKHLSNLSRQLQVERHRAGSVPTPPDFNPNQLHRDVHGLFLSWARSRSS